MHRCMLRLALLTAGVGVACATSPTGRKQLLLLPKGQVAELGVVAFDDIKTKEQVSTNSAMTTYVNCIASAIIAANRDQVAGAWEVVTFESEQVNAFALPGNKVGIYTGMARFADNPAQLAAVVGHEVGHVLAEHGNERMSKALAAEGGMSLIAAYQGGGETQQLILGALGLGIDLGVIRPFSRTQESEADNIGLMLMAKAGFDPKEAVALWTKMGARGDSGPEFLSTHPSPDTRVKGLEALQAQAAPRFQQARAAGRNPDCRKPS